MTYCLAIRVAEGLLALADGRITSGNQVTTARKMTLHGVGDRRFALLTSGLRSVRDKTIAYLERHLREDKPEGFDSLIDAATAYAACLRRVADEDRDALARSALPFDLHTLIAGHLPGDPHPTVYLIYPEGNWVEVTERTPYLSIGATAYGKPILDRALRFDTPLRHAMKIAYLSFDSTRFSAANVGFPIDMATLPANEREWRHDLYDYDELLAQRDWWNVNITRLAESMPDGPWIETLLPRTLGPRLSVVAEE